MFGWEFPPHNSGGLGVACYGLTRALSELGLGISFVMPKKLEVGAPWVVYVCAISSVQEFRWVLPNGRIGYGMVMDNAAEGYQSPPRPPLDGHTADCRLMVRHEENRNDKTGKRRSTKPVLRLAPAFREFHCPEIPKIS